MTNVDAYELACKLWGKQAGVWSAGGKRFVVGIWQRAIETKHGDRTALRGNVHVLRVLGEGRSWTAAFRQAEGAK